MFLCVFSRSGATNPNVSGKSLMSTSTTSATGSDDGSSSTGSSDVDGMEDETDDDVVTSSSTLGSQLVEFSVSGILTIIFLILSWI